MYLGPFDAVDQRQGTGDDRAAGLPRIEELLFVDLLGHGVVAHEHQLDLLVIAFEKQIEQQEDIHTPLQQIWVIQIIVQLMVQVEMVFLVQQ